MPPPGAGAAGSGAGMSVTRDSVVSTIAAMLAARLGRDRRLPVALLACAIGGVAGIAATYGWWAAHLAAATGNPVFPYFNDLFHAAQDVPRAFGSSHSKS